MTGFWTSPLGWTLGTVGAILLVTIGVLLSVAFLLLADRKIWAGVQMRKGPNVVGPFGLLQSFADFFKFVLKEVVVPAGSDKAVFLLAPVLTVIVAFGAWAVIPFAPGWVASCTSSPSARWASTASSWAGGLRTRSIRSWDRCGLRRRWCPTRCRSGW